MNNEYTKVCSFDGIFEFGYYTYPDGGCVDEHKVVARYWETDSYFLDEKILAYEDSPGEAIEVISQYVKQGLIFENVYGKKEFNGGYYLVYSEDGYIPFDKGKYIKRQTDKLFKKGLILEDLDIVMAVKSKVHAIYDEDGPLSEFPYLEEKQVNGNTYSLTMSWDF